MNVPRIPQPFVVVCRLDPASNSVLTDWCRENIQEDFYAVGTGTLHHLYSCSLPMNSNQYDWDYEKHPSDTVFFMFKCPRDALLFKLSWGGENTAME